MSRFYGKIGYGESQETPSNSGVWVDVITEKPYYGNVIRSARRLSQDDQLNQNITVQNSISIIADNYALEHFLFIKYVEWSGKPWVVSDVQIERPRLILTLGDLYNGPRP